MIGERELPPPPEQGFQIVTPVLEIPAGTEQFWCFYGEYDGPDVGVYKMVVHQDPEFSHHSLLKEPLVDDHPSGSLVNCTSLDEQLPPRPTLLEAVGVVDDEEEHPTGQEDGLDDWLEGHEWVNLPRTMGFRFVTGQRWLADVHFVNTSPEPILTRAVFDLHTRPAEEIEAFVGTFNHDAGGFSLPAGQETEVAFDCAWDEDVTILAMGGHMHDHGRRYTVDVVDGDGALLRPAVYDEEWRDSFRFEPPVSQFAPGDFMVRAGDAFRTRCRWMNDGAGPLSYPDEMCTTFGVAYPAPDSLYCTADQHLP